MATLQFPDAPGPNAVYDAPNGVQYVWTGEYWAANDAEDKYDARYVKVTGDNMTGNLTLGGDKIDLDASSGDIAMRDLTFRDISGQLGTFNRSAGSSNALDIGIDNVSSAYWKADGEIQIGGTLTNDPNTTVPNISIKADGNITAAGVSTFKGATLRPTDVSGGLFVMNPADDTDAVVTASGDGSFTAAGILKAGTTNFFEFRPQFGVCQLSTTSSDRNQSILYGQSQVGGSTFDAFKISCNGSTSLGNFNDASDTAVGILLDINTNSSQIYMQADNGYSTANSAIEVWLGTTRKWRVTYGGVASYSNVVFDLDPDNSANYVSTTNAEGETTTVYNGPTLDVKDRLQKADGALQALKTAAAASTDFASLKAAIASALANI